MNRLLHSLTMGTAVNRGSRAIVHAKAEHRPAVILAGLEDVDFVTALGSVLGDEHVSGLWMDGQTLHVAMAIRPRGGQRRGLSDERIVGRHPPIVVQTDCLAVVRREVLRGMCLEVSTGFDLSVAERDEQVAVLVERQPGAVMSAPTRPYL